MKIVSAAGSKVVLEHIASNGKTQKIEVAVDNDSRKFIKENINVIKYDSANDVLRVRDENGNTTLARAYAETRFDIPVGRKVQFVDGNRLNLKTKNIYIAE